MQPQSPRNSGGRSKKSLSTAAHSTGAPKQHVKQEIEMKRNSKQNDMDERPFWLSFWFYLALSLLGLGWVLRLVIYSRSSSANFFLKKVVLR